MSNQPSSAQALYFTLNLTAIRAERRLGPEACRLADAGWLERRYVDATGDWSWFWTPRRRRRST